MNHSDSVLETRLRGALSEIADHAPPAPTMGDVLSGVARNGRDTSSRSRGRLGPMLAVAAVAVIIGGAGTVVVRKVVEGPGGGEDTAVIDPGQQGGTTTTPGDVSDPPAASYEAVDDVDVAEQLTAYELTPGYGRVAVDYASTEVTVLWKGKPPSGVQKLAGTHPNGVTVSIGPARYSEAELVDAGRRLLQAPKPQIDGATVALTVGNADLSGLIVEIVKPWSGSTAPLEQTAQVPVTVRLIDDDERPKQLKE